MGGSGKTVLTAKAVRDADLLRTVFPGGVNWFKVGHIDMADHLDRAKLLENLVTLILRLDHKNVHDVPRYTVEAAADYLHKVYICNQLW